MSAPILYKAVRPDYGSWYRGWEWASGTPPIIWTPGTVVTHPKIPSLPNLKVPTDRYMRTDASYYLSATSRPREVPGSRFGSRLLRVQPVGPFWTPGNYYPNKVAAYSYKVIDEVPAWQMYGPHGVRALRLHSYFSWIWENRRSISRGTRLNLARLYSQMQTQAVYYCAMSPKILTSEVRLKYIKDDCSFEHVEDIFVEIVGVGNFTQIINLLLLATIYRDEMTDGFGKSVLEAVDTAWSNAFGPGGFPMLPEAVGVQD